MSAPSTCGRLPAAASAKKLEIGRVFDKDGEREKLARDEGYRRALGEHFKGIDSDLTLLELQLDNPGIDGITSDLRVTGFALAGHAAEVAEASSAEEALALK